ncbi:MAG: hypothetical protein RJQ09_20510 [Cyclobacteriaceae bacterium]
MKKLIGFVLIAIVGCSQYDEEEALNIYFDLDTILQNQISHLKATNPTVTKKVELNGETEKTETKIDTGYWATELNLFIEADINKPSFVGAFTEERNGNLVTYSRKDSNADGVQKFIVELFPASEQPKEINISTKNINSLYESSRTLSLKFKLADILQLTGYQVAGKQKILSQEPTKYLVDVQIDYQNRMP